MLAAIESRDPSAGCDCSCKQSAQQAIGASAVSGSSQSSLVDAAAPSSFHRRDLPAECVPFSSAEGKRLFIAAIGAAPSFMEIYFPLAEQFITQAEPAYCGLATLAMCLNALKIDPGRVWKGPWRWFSEELFDCCTPLSVAKERGISLAEFVCLAQCNGATPQQIRATAEFSLDDFRAIIKRSCSGVDAVVVLNYSRKVLGQTGDGHFSPIGGYHEAEDMVLLMDVARFKYPPHWIKLELAFASMQLPDSTLNQPRGLVVLQENKQLNGPLPVNQANWREAIGSVNESVQPLASCCNPTTSK